ncbi:MAG: head-tail adaptor protein [Immundisolibacteraceae bacterium]|nr:head-tail adaptor protein [Immundisolibacteraceae bacterium]
MKAGKLRDRISFGDLSFGSDGQGGKGATIWTEISKIWCLIEEGKPQKLRADKTSRYLRSVSITTRINSQLNRSKTLLIDGKYFEIEQFSKVVRNGEVEIVANEKE